MECQVGVWVYGEKGFELYYCWVLWLQVLLWVLLVMVVGEDQKFLFYYGFDFDQIQDVLDVVDEGKCLCGVSMISQQMVKNLFLWNGCSFVCKGLEVYFIVLLEIIWLKWCIFEVYMNIVEFGDGIYGVGVVSDVYFYVVLVCFGFVQVV